MKNLLMLIFSIAFFINAKSQNYVDSTITLTLTQRSAIYVGLYVKQNTSSMWANRLAPSNLKTYVGTGTHLDSVFTVTLKVDYIMGLINLLLNGQNEMVQADKLSIINNSPSIPGYTALATQVGTIAAGNTSQKNTAQYIVDYYNAQVASSSATRAQIINNIVQWSQN